MINEIRQVLDPSLLKPVFRKQVEAGAHPMTGHCYVASEALYHMMGGKSAGLKPMSVNMGDCVHWWIQTAEGEVLDPTADQFDRPVPYGSGRARGFLTKQPSKRAQVVIDRINGVNHGQA
jgi:hypothetical protein